MGTKTVLPLNRPHRITGQNCRYFEAWAHETHITIIMDLAGIILRLQSIFFIDVVLPEAADCERLLGRSRLEPVCIF